MTQFINALSTGPLSVSFLMILVVALVGFYILYVVPKFKAIESNSEDLKIKDKRILDLEKALRKATDSSKEKALLLLEVEKNLREANTVIKEYVENNEVHANLSRSMGEVLNVVRETYSVVVHQFKSTENDLDDLSKNLTKAIDSISDMSKQADRGSSDKFNKVDTELRFLSQQLMNINQRLASIVGIIVSSPNRHLDGLLGVDERDLK